MGRPKGTDFRIGRSRSRGDHPTYAWAVAAGLLPAAAALLARARAVDLAYHVRAGELALRTGGVVRTDPFTFTRGGLPWLNQQWGAQLLFAKAHRLGGWTGVAATHAAVIGAGFSFLYGSCRRAGADPRRAALLTLAGFVVGAGSLGVRPQSLAVPLFTGTWLLLARRDRWTWLVPLLAAVWANVHGSFVLAPLLAAFALAEDLTERRPVAGPGAILVATVLATFLTPFGPAVWSYAADVAMDPTIRATVAEWRPPSILSGPGALFWLSGVAVAAAGVLRRASIRPVDVVRLVVFFALGAAAVRSTLWWALAAPPIVAAWLGADDPVDEPTTPPRRLRVVGASVIVVLLLALVALVRSGTDPVTGGPARLGADAPETLVEVTRRALPAGSRLLVFQPFASWFEFSLPGYPVMVDSRIELFAEQVWDEYDRAIVAGEGWEEILDRHRVQAVILPPGAVLASELSESGVWRRATDDAAGSVFVRI